VILGMPTSCHEIPSPHQGLTLPSPGSDNCGPQPLELTFGVVDVGGKTYGECSDATIRRYLRDKDLAWQREGVPFRVWLTSPAFEVLDITFAMVTSQTREQCAKRLIYKPTSTSHLSQPVYHPKVVGVDFLEQTGALFDTELV
jgi:hypothetical protein